MPPQPADQPDRREFFKKASAILIGSGLALVPVGAGLTVLFDPLGRKSTTAGFVFVAALDALPEDGIPRKFPVVSTRADAWNRFAEVPIGAVYLRRTAERQVEAFNAVCPHAGCFVDFKPGLNEFICPCHNSAFAPDGRIASRASPSPRGLDTLAVEIRNRREVWIRFQNFLAGRSEKIPVA